MTVPFAEEDDTGDPVSLGMSGPVMVIDVSDEILFFARQYDPVTDSDHEIFPYHGDHVACIPQVNSLLTMAKSWLANCTDDVTAFYSAQEDPGAASKKPPPPPKASAVPKRVTNAVLMEQINAMMAQVQQLALRQDASEKKEDYTPSVAIAPGPSGGNPCKLPAVSDGLASVAAPPLEAPKALALIGCLCGRWAKAMRRPLKEVSRCLLNLRRGFKACV